jgi:hypothetical protein
MPMCILSRGGCNAEVVYRLYGMLLGCVLVRPLIDSHACRLAAWIHPTGKGLTERPLCMYSCGRNRSHSAGRARDPSAGQLTSQLAGQIPRPSRQPAVGLERVLLTLGLRRPKPTRRAAGARGPAAGDQVGRAHAARSAASLNSELRASGRPAALKQTGRRGHRTAVIGPETLAGSSLPTARPC